MIPDGSGGSRPGKEQGGSRGPHPRFLVPGFLLLACLALSAGCLTSPRPGSIGVASEPAGATVYLGGVPAGTAPLEIPNLTPGDYVLLFRKAGYGDREVTVTVTAGNRTWVTARYPPPATPAPTPTPQVTVVPTTPGLPFVTVTPEPGSLYLTSFPVGASVTVNGVVRGKTPVLIQNLPPGTYHVRYSLVGWDDFNSFLSVSSGQTMTDDVTLRQ